MPAELSGLVEYVVDGIVCFVLAEWPGGWKATLPFPQVGSAEEMTACLRYAQEHHKLGLILNTGDVVFRFNGCGGSLRAFAVGIVAEDPEDRM